MSRIPKFLPLFCLCILFFSQTILAQSNEELEQETPLLLEKELKPKTELEHTLGLQANQLLKQLNILGGNTANTNNPYLLIYSLGLKNKGISFDAGLGFNFVQTKQEATNTNFIDNEAFFRLGVSKYISLGKKFDFGVGFDLSYDIEDFFSETIDSNFNPIIGDFEDFISEVNDDRISYGGGLRLAFDFKITDRILLGTEVLYYYKQTYTNFKVINYFASEGPENTEHPSFSESTEKFVSNRFGLNVPSVIYLKFKL